MIKTNLKWIETLTHFACFCSIQSTHFGNHEKSREGFEKLFRKLSDSTWNDAIDLIQYITKRGGVMDFQARKTKAEVRSVWSHTV